MATYQTRKSTAAARTQTIARRRARNAKSAATITARTTRAGRCARS